MRKAVRRLLAGIFVIIVGMLMISFLYREVLALTLLLIILSLLALRLARFKKKDICYYIAGAITGTFVEIVSIHFGTWSYAHPTFLNIPLWLPPAWGLAVLVVRKMAEAVFIKD
jgi:uncharacterized membrane protein YoaT (DUF817 family)